MQQITQTRWPMKWALLVVLVLTIGIAACDENPVSPTEVRNVTWKLETIERTGSATITVPNPEQFTVRFESNGNLSVRADCNSCGGRYVLDGPSLSISGLACTLIACPTPGLDATFTTALGTVRSATISGDRLVITGTDFTLRFRN
jgi:heat shock protein HslJ